MTIIHLLFYYLALILSSVIGFILGKFYIFNNTRLSGPNSNEIRAHTYELKNGSFIKFDIDMCVCPPSSKNLYKEKMKNK